MVFLEIQGILSDSDSRAQPPRELAKAKAGCVDLAESTPVKVEVQTRVCRKTENCSDPDVQTDVKTWFFVRLF